MKLWRQHHHWWQHHSRLADRVEALEQQVRRLKAHSHRMPDDIFAGCFTDDPWYYRGDPG
jgi:hypothetical protein